MVKDINPGTGYGVDDLYVIDSALYLQASDGVHGFELWKSDGTSAGTVQVLDLNAGDASGFGFILN
jgi:ELWxxDGT repeat protein